MNDKDKEMHRIIDAVIEEWVSLSALFFYFRYLGINSVILVFFITLRKIIKICLN